jgi:hypothetical protein
VNLVCEGDAKDVVVSLPQVSKIAQSSFCSPPAVLARLSEQGAYTAQSPAKRPGEGGNGGDMPVTALTACMLSSAAKSSRILNGGSSYAAKPAPVQTLEELVGRG